jgi:hypothetical protein
VAPLAFPQIAPTGPLSALTAISFNIILLIVAPVAVPKRGCVNPLITGKLPFSSASSVKVPVNSVTLGEYEEALKLAVII